MIDNEDIIRMAIDAGATGCANPDKWGILEISYENLARFAALRDRLAQPERKWVGLTDDDYETLSQFAFVEVIEKVEALLKEKNT
jgi:hypothetical protein